LLAEDQPAIAMPFPPASLQQQLEPKSHRDERKILGASRSTGSSALGIIMGEQGIGRG
jgi:hypothetical protein